MSLGKIKNRNELARLLGIPTKLLTYILYIKKTDNLYSRINLLKKNGDERIIYAPEKELKSIQKKLANILYQERKAYFEGRGITPNISHGFEQKKNIISNARIHCNKRFIFNLDLEDFFGRVKGYFEKNNQFKLDSQIAILIAQIACYKGFLPQGAPTSPIITNMICSILDYRLLKLAKHFKLDYTRYADDLTFSTNDKKFLDNKDVFYKRLSREIEKAGFKINCKKTRLQFKDYHQEVTGLTVNKKVNVKRFYYRQTRAMAHRLYKTGEFEIDGKKGTIDQLEGRFSFMYKVASYGSVEMNYCYKEYKKFIFYKYFYMNDNPVVITEGKTDIVYLKAALKNLHEDYPRLISKQADGTFEFKITFLNRKPERLKKFLNLQEMGANGISTFINEHFLCKNSTAKYFKNIDGPLSKNAIVCIFDNEIEDQGKPLRGVYNGFNKDHKKQEALKNHQNTHWVDNVYILTNPLVSGKKTCEIEDLFDDQTLNIQLNGKKFNRKQEKHKQLFSMFINKNYNVIDFTQFKPMLDNLDKIIYDYSNSTDKCQ
ncbi:retron Ec67 family RNA-directed DNA polymerase/endonuclease [Listeria fleischmannii]|uniref:retron Ec67 family RNA-directed DNA polymerase/endonuclease n=1 Tax=Listeria fleischmannii TaxID=1069827 RepID=UPI001625CC42|nr:retron Ec67 family RNA-directed DNA polymerase/endonuclease [Listeria fleischmannii]MBC1419910.1 RNA-directed DNA polymerase [Listeria fleischmannii]